MSDAASHPHMLDLPRDENGLATSIAAVRRVEELIPAFLSEFVADAGADGVVVRLDGGVDTTVAATLAVDALGPDRVTGLVLPARLSDEASAREAEAVASMLEIDHSRIPLQPILTAFQQVVDGGTGPTDDLVATRNATERFRTVCEYYVANTSNALVVGATNRTDRLLGSVTKYGETGVDCHLLADLYGTEVRALAGKLDLPEELLEPPAMPGASLGTSAAETLDLAPHTVDRLLRLHIDEGADAATVASEVDVDYETVTRVAEWCATTRHKRHQPPKPSTHV